MKIVINVQFGGFSLSSLAIQEIAKLKGKQCFFFKHKDFLGEYIPITLEEADKEFMFSAFSVPNPNEVLRDNKEWNDMTLEERKASNKKYEKYALDKRDIARDDEDLIKVVEKLGGKANGKHATLKIVKIPNGVKWCVKEYDGNEWVAEEHRTWE